MDHDAPRVVMYHNLRHDGNCSLSRASARGEENSLDRDYTSVRNSRQNMWVATQVYRVALQAWVKVKDRAYRVRLLAGSLAELPAKALVAEAAPYLDGESLRPRADTLDDLKIDRQRLMAQVKEEAIRLW